MSIKEKKTGYAIQGTLRLTMQIKTQSLQATATIHNARNINKFTMSVPTADCKIWLLCPTISNK